MSYKPSEGELARQRARGYVWDDKTENWTKAYDPKDTGQLVFMRNGIPYDKDGKPITLMAGVQLPDSLVAGRRTVNRPGVELPQGREERKGSQTVGQVSQKWINCTPEAGKPIIVDWERGNRQFAVLSENQTVSFRNPKDQTCCLVLRQDATGNFTVSWCLNGTGLPVCHWVTGTEPVMTPTAYAIDMYSFVWISDWTFYLGMYTQDMRVPAE